MTVRDRSHPVRLPHEFTVSSQEYPQREPPDSQAHFDIFGMDREPPPTGHVPGIQPGKFVVSTESRAPNAVELEALARICPGAGWHFTLDALDVSRVTGLSVTVPHGRGNMTWSLMASQPLPWPSPPPGTSITVRAASADRPYKLTVMTVRDGHWRWQAEAVERPAPWLSWFDLHLISDPPQLPSESLSVRFRSAAPVSAALQADLELTSWFTYRRDRSRRDWSDGPMRRIREELGDRQPRWARILGKSPMPFHRVSRWVDEMTLRGMNVGQALRWEDSEGTLWLKAWPPGEDEPGWPFADHS